MVRPNSKDDAVTRSHHHARFSKLAALGLLLSACLLAGCGRKGPLDLPPGAAAQAPAVSRSSEESTDPNSRMQNSGSNAADPSLFGGPSTSNGPMVAPRGEKKRIPIDAILD
jgi:predicted small lipoprotein YifL